MMSIGQQILFFISALGAFNGILLSVYLLISRKRSTPAYLFLSVLLLAISIRVAKSVFLYFNPQLPKIYLQIGLSACFLIGPAVYFFFKAVLEKVTQVPNSWKWHWGILVGILLLTGIILPYQIYPGIWNNIIVFVIYLQWLVYLIATGFILKNVLKAAIVNPIMLKNADKFRLILFVGNCLIFLVYLLSLFNVIYGMYISGAVFFTAILYLTIFFHLKGVQFEHSGLSSKPERKKIDDTNAQIWIAKLESIITSQTLYKDPNLKLNDLAKHINISVHQLSQLLNENLGKSFSTYINEFRINEACKLITTNERLTFEAIGYEVGYNSKSTFYAAFRKIKNTTPALYKESTTNKI